MEARLRDPELRGHGAQELPRRQAGVQDHPDLVAVAQAVHEGPREQGLARAHLAREQGQVELLHRVEELLQGLLVGLVQEEVARDRGSCGRASRAARSALRTWLARATGGEARPRSAPRGAPRRGPGVSRMSTTRPSPMMVAPATPKAAPETAGSRALITISCWPAQPVHHQADAACRRGRGPPRRARRRPRVRGEAEERCARCSRGTMRSRMRRVSRPLMRTISLGRNLRLSTTEPRGRAKVRPADLHQQGGDDGQGEGELDDELGAHAPGTLSASTRPFSRSMDFSTTSRPTPRPETSVTWAGGGEALGEDELDRLAVGHLRRRAPQDPLLARPPRRTWAASMPAPVVHDRDDHLVRLLGGGEQDGAGRRSCRGPAAPPGVSMPWSTLLRIMWTRGSPISSMMALSTRVPSPSRISSTSLPCCRARSRTRRGKRSKTCADGQHPDVHDRLLELGGDARHLLDGVQQLAARLSCPARSCASSLPSSWSLVR